jgi:predicted DNA-binding ribbon-helix-helix protein
MCKLFVTADPELWQTRSKSLRMHGFSTSVRLEHLYWQVLDEIAQREEMTLSRLLTTLYEELLRTRGEVDNFSSFLRVCCGRYLMLQITGDIPRSGSLSVNSLNAESTPAHEARLSARKDQEADQRPLWGGGISPP